MGLFSKIIRKTAGVVEKTADMRPGFFEAMVDLEKKVNIPVVNNAELTGNVVFHKSNLFEVNKALDEININDLTQGEVGAMLNVRAKYLDGMAAVDLDKGGLISTGQVRSEISKFETKVGQIEEEFKKSTPDTVGIAKFTSAVRNTLDNRGKKALSLPTDYKVDTRALIGLDDEIKAFNNASTKSNFEDWVTADNKGNMDGFFQNNFKMMEPSASHVEMASQVASYFSDEIDNGFKKFSIAIPDSELKQLGTKAAIEHIETITDLIETHFNKTPDTFFEKQFREGVTNVDMIRKLRKVKSNLLERFQNESDVNYAKKVLAKHNGDMLGKHLDKITIENGKLSNSGKAILSMIDTKIHDVFTYSYKNIIPKEGLSVKSLQKGAGQLVKALYMFDSLGEAMPIEEVIEAAYKLDKHQFSTFVNPNIVEHLTKHLKTNDEYLGAVFKRLDETELHILDDTTIKKLTAGDHGIGNDISKEIASKVKGSLRSFKMSNAGYLGMDKVKIDTSAFGGVGQFMEKGITPSTISQTDAVIKNAEKLIKDGFFNKTATRTKEMFPMLAKLFRNGGVSEKVTMELAGINKFFNRVHSLKKELDIIGSKYSVLGNKNLDLVGGFKNKSIKLGEHEQVIYKANVDLNAAMKDELVKVGYFSDKGASEFAGSMVNRSTKNMATKEDFLTAEKVVKKFLKTDNINEAVKKTIESLAVNGEKLEYWTRMVEDVIDPIGAELRLTDNLSRAIVQVEYLKSLESNKSVLFNAAPGYRKLTGNEINLKMLEDVFGTSNVYLPQIEVEFLRRTVSTYGNEVRKTATQMVKDFSLGGIASASRHAALMFPTTRLLVDSGNMLMAWAQLGITPIQFFKHYSDYFKFKKLNSIEFQAFQKSGVASESGLASVINREGKDFGKKQVNQFAKKYNILDRGSDVSQIAYHYMIDQPDEMFRFMVWRELTGKGIGIEDVNKVIRGTIGHADEAPALIKAFANIPFGDVFATYNYMMTKNFAQLLSNNPKQFFKIAAYMAAMQQGSIYLFLNENERESLKNGKENWMKPTLFNSVRLDPSFATWGGRYNVANFHSPWTTGFGGGMDSLRPEAILLKGIMNQSSSKSMVNRQVKAARKISQSADALGRGQYGEAFYKLLGPTYTRKLNLQY